MTAAACLLALDTTTTLMSVALAHAGGVDELHEDGGARASQRLLPMIDALLRRAGVAPAQLDALAFGCGPGAFTGLRTACATVQGLALAWGKPVIAVSSLQALAAQAREGGLARPLLCALDARMGEVYWAIYSGVAEGKEGDAALYLNKPQDIAAPAGAWAGCGNAWQAEALSPHMPQPTAGLLQAVPTARGVLAVAQRAFAAGGVTDAVHAEPIYVRNKVALTTAERAAAAGSA